MDRSLFFSLFFLLFLDASLLQAMNSTPMDQSDDLKEVLGKRKNRDEHGASPKKRSCVGKENSSPNTELPVWLNEALKRGKNPISFHAMMAGFAMPKDVYYDTTLGCVQLKNQQQLFKAKLDGKPDDKETVVLGTFALVKETWADEDVMVLYGLKIEADYAGKNFVVPGAQATGRIIVFPGHDEKMIIKKPLFSDAFYKSSIGYCSFSWYAIPENQHTGIHIDRLHGDEKYEKEELKKFIFEKLCASLQDHTTSCFWISTSHALALFGEKTKDDFKGFGFKFRPNVVNDATSGVQRHIFPVGAEWLYVMKKS